MGFRRDRDHLDSWNDLVAENVFGFGVEFVGIAVDDFQVTGVLLGAGELGDEGANGRFDEVGAIFEGVGKLVNRNQEFFRQGDGGFDFHTTNILPLGVENNM